MGKVPGFTQGMDLAAAGLTNGNADELILGLVNDRGGFTQKGDELALGEAGLENAVLLGQAVFFAQLVDLAKTLGVCNVIHDEVGALG